MTVTIQDPELGTLTYKENFWTGSKTIMQNGVMCRKSDRRNFFADNGQLIQLEGNYLKGSKLIVGGRTYQLTPSVKWYESLLSVIPFVLILAWGNSVALCNIVPVVGGAIGGGISGLFSMINLLVIKQTKNVFLKILITAGFIAVTFLVCFGIASAILSAASKI